MWINDVKLLSDVTYKNYMKVRDNLSVNIVITVLTAIILIVEWSLLSTPLSGDAQTSQASPSKDVKKKMPTSGGALDVLLDSSPNPLTTVQNSNLKVTFLKKGTMSVQPH